MIIQSNILAMNARRNLIGIGRNQAKASEKLSSGLRINRAADDAAGLAISEKMRAQKKGLDQADRNIWDGISLVQTAEGVLSEIQSKLHRIRELAIQSANDTNTPEDREKIQQEINQLTEKIHQMTTTAEFNRIRLFDSNEICKIETEWITLQTDYPTIIHTDNPFSLTTLPKGSMAQVANTPPYLATLDSGSPTFPKDGLFVIQIAEQGHTYNVVLDFSDPNWGPNGNNDLADFEAYFQNAFNGIGANVLIAPIATIDTAGGQIKVTTNDFGGTGSVVRVGIDNIAELSTSTTVTTISNQPLVLNTNMRFVNSALWGATVNVQTATNYSAFTLQGGFSLTAWAEDPRSEAYSRTMTINGVTYPVRVDEITPANQAYQIQLNEFALELLQDYAMTCPVFWQMLPDNFTFGTGGIQWGEPNPNAGQPIPGTGAGTGWTLAYQQSPIWPTGMHTLHPPGGGTVTTNGDTWTVGQLRAMMVAQGINVDDQSLEEVNNMLQLSEADGGFTRNWFTNASYPTTNLNNFNPNINIDRNGTILVNLSNNVASPLNTAWLIPNNAPAVAVRSTTHTAHSTAYHHNPGNLSNSTNPNGILGINPPNSVVFPGTTTDLKTGGLATIISNYPATPSDAIGLLDITISGIPGLGSVTADIDFSDPKWNPSNFSSEANRLIAMIKEINDKLNTNPPIPRPAFQPTTAGTSYDSDKYPVARAFIENGRLVIQASERTFTIQIEEKQSDKPMFAATQNIRDTGNIWSYTYRITGSPFATQVGDTDRVFVDVPIEPKEYTSITDFISTNYQNFANNGFFLTEHPMGQLKVTSIAKGAQYNVIDCEINVSVLPLPPNSSTMPPGNPARGTPPINTDIHEQLGFGISHWYTPGSTRSHEEERLVAEWLAPKDLWIQSGSNAMQGMLLYLPPLNGYILGLLPSNKTYKICGMNTGNNIATPEEGINVLTREGCNDAISIADNATEIISVVRANLGANQNRLESTARYVQGASENLSESMSRIEDADMAKEMMKFTKANVLQQAAVSMLAQANQNPQMVLQLLR